MHTQTRVVDNRVFLLGLDELYREKMKVHERGELLNAARTTCHALGVEPQTGPVEGYYSEDELLTEYFQRMRALQDVPADQSSRVAGLPAFRRLLEVCSAPLYGEPVFNNKLLPTGKDPLSRALEATSPWTIAGLTSAAHELARASDDFSLVGLAALAKDSVVLTSLRETVVLYAYAVLGAAPMRITYVYEWSVDPIVAERANRFIRAFNDLFDDTLPAAVPANAERFWAAHDATNFLARCVRLGSDDSVSPLRHYHWAVALDGRVREFWSEELWTTERFRTALGAPKTLPFRV